MRGLATGGRRFRRQWVACLGSPWNRCRTTCLLIEGARIVVQEDPPYGGRHRQRKRKGA
jgi:hypothetical protein